MNIIADVYVITSERGRDYQQDFEIDTEKIVSFSVVNRNRWYKSGRFRGFVKDYVVVLRQENDATQTISLVYGNYDFPLIRKALKGKYTVTKNPVKAYQEPSRNKASYRSGKYVNAIDWTYRVK